MAKKNSFSTILIAVVFVFSLFTVFYTNLKSDTAVPYISDKTVSWNDIESITISADGYFGRTIDEEIVVADKNDVKKLVKYVRDTKNYKPIPTDEYLEGTCGIFVEFSNGCVISMYEDENYGTIGLEKNETAPKGEGYYKFPEKFRNEIIDILKENEPIK